MAELIEKPTPPASHECCGGGSCCPCVWDRYRDNLRQWQIQNGETVAPVARPASEPSVYR